AQQPRRRQLHGQGRHAGREHRQRQVTFMNWWVQWASFLSVRRRTNQTALVSIAIPNTTAPPITSQSAHPLAATLWTGSAGIPCKYARSVAAWLISAVRLHMLAANGPPPP